ncbi:WD40-repeat-containing domain protein [Mycena rosella]|uniref:WD40-repeat-containing domain protein n=1 Tax=Mycena rosella TaxID=1033263 RepID=A0AAD7GYN7_MYCRO|nr:WD40-repeat-containing domain protein [Mycena rosella]
MSSAAEYTWAPPEFDLTHPPQSTDSFTVLSDPSLPGNFARSAKWCPDGSVALVQCEHREFRLISPRSEMQNEASSSQLVWTLPQPAPILEYAWYPGATPANPATFCFVASVRETPVKLLDASDGRLRASYRIVDHRERQIAPHSLAFNLSATRLYCGFEDAIEVFDIGRPGEGTRLPTSPSKKSRDGLKGIISALAFSPSYESDFYAAGSLTAAPGNIAVFSEAEGAVPVLFVSGGPVAGVTQLHFNPMRPEILYAAFRRRREIYSWDLRADVSAPLKIYSATSSVTDPPIGETNQKRRFDVDVGGRFLSVGDQEGNISVFDVSASAEDDMAIGTPSLKFSAHDDAIGAVAFHPTKAQLLSVSGSRHFQPPADGSGSDSEDDDDPDPEDDGGEGSVRVRESTGVQRAAARPTPVPRDASVKVWDFGGRR